MPQQRCHQVPRPMRRMARSVMDLTTLDGLRAGLGSGRFTPAEVLDEVERRIDAWGDAGAIWIRRVPRDEIDRRLLELEEARSRGEVLPLYGIPFAVKDNFDTVGMPTTVACPAFAYDPTEDAPAVRRLLDAGAVLVGKTNMDQFATGLTGTRSPHGVPRCVQNPAYIPGGSSSGSAVAVAMGSVTFSLGSDTAGSGRVPAALNGIVGIKPTKGRVSARGVIPACPSLDCVSVFAHSVRDAEAVLRIIEGHDPKYPYSRRVPAGAPKPDSGRFRFGVPPKEQLEFFGDLEAEGLYWASVEQLSEVGGERVEFDFRPLEEVTRLLYEGPWVAERDAAIGDFVRGNVGVVHPVVRSILLASGTYSARDAFRAMHRLQELRSRVDPLWDDLGLLALPTAGTTYRVDAVLADPYRLNATLGRYVNFVNLLDLCGVAVPAGFRENRTPFGITLVGPAFADEAVAHVAARYEDAYRRTVSAPALVPPQARTTVCLAVAGAHLSGEPLNPQLSGRGAQLVQTCRTAGVYRMYALRGTVPEKPGLTHVGPGGAPIEVEVWELGEEAFGSFVAEVPPPLAIGTLELEDGSSVKGFVCEPRALDDAEDITRFGGWRAYRRSLTDRTV